MSAEPMVRLADVREAFDAMCPACAKKVRDALIAALSEKRESRETSLPGLRRTVASEYEISEEALSSRSASSRLVAARREFSKRARTLGFSLNEIGEALGRDHSSISYLINGKNGWFGRSKSDGRAAL